MIIKVLDLEWIRRLYMTYNVMQFRGGDTWFNMHTGVHQWINMNKCSQDEWNEYYKAVRKW